MIVEEAQVHPDFKYLPVTHEEPFHSYLGQPLQVRGLAIGVLYIQTREQRRFTEDEVRALSAIASQVAPVVDNARLLQLIAGEESALAPHADETGPRHYYGAPCSAGVVHGPILRLTNRPPDPPETTGTPQAELEGHQTG